MIHFKCNHCGHFFEAETRDGLECPRCFWSSSIAEAAQEGTPKTDVRPSVQVKNKSSNPPKKAPWIPWVVAALLVILTLALLILSIFFAARFREVFSSKKETLHLPVKEGEVQEASEALSNDLTAQKKNLKPEDLAILERRISLTADRPLSEEESKILKAQASFSTGMRETLPSKIWSEADFKSLLDDQQKLYRVPLPWSYRRKLEKLFKEKYLAAETAFQAGEMIQARNLWVAALAFPVYGNDVRLHRGVVLTMLRSYINDTLSKIGAVNTSISEKKIREQEMEISRKYQELFAKIEKSDWEGVTDEIRILDQLLDQLEKPVGSPEPLPSYPPGIAQVDEGIRATLLGLQEVPRAPLSSFNALRVDLKRKLSVAQSFQAERVRESQALYESALEAVARGEISQAEQKFHDIDYPLALYQDAQEKIRILRKLQASVFSPPSSASGPAEAVPVRVSVKKGA